MRNLLGRVFLVAIFSLSSLYIYCTTPSWPAKFLLKTQLIVFWEFLYLLFVAFLLLLLVFFFFNFCHFDYNVSLYVSLWVDPAWDFLGFLDLRDYSLFQVRESFSKLSLQIFFQALPLSSLSGTSIMWILVHLSCPRGLLQCPHLILFFPFLL